MSYTDLTNTFETRLLIDWQNWDQLAENDKDNYLPSGTKALFCQASAPLGWTQDTGVNARALRVVSGGSGGSTGGGSQDPGAAMTFPHSHSVNSHTHTISAHRHVLDYSASAASFTGGGTNLRLYSLDSDGSPLTRSTGGGSTSGRVHRNRTSNDGNVSSGANTDTTDSDSLFNTALKYMNSIICTKD